MILSRNLATFSQVPTTARLLFLWLFLFCGTLPTACQAALKAPATPYPSFVVEDWEDPRDLHTDKMYATQKAIEFVTNRTYKRCLTWVLNDQKKEENLFPMTVPKDIQPLIKIYSLEFLLEHVLAFFVGQEVQQQVAQKNLIGLHFFYASQEDPKKWKSRFEYSHVFYRNPDLYGFAQKGKKITVILPKIYLYPLADALLGHLKQRPTLYWRGDYGGYYCQERVGFIVDFLKMNENKKGNAFPQEKPLNLLLGYMDSMTCQSTEEVFVASFIPSS